jgi:hypothetical protein
MSVQDLMSAAGPLGALAGTPKCQQIDVYSLKYVTAGGANEITTSSGALMVPSGTDSACQGNRPIVLYAHGTVPTRDFDIAAIDAGGEGTLIAAFFAANGYIVVAPNYAGYSTSTLSYHPYLNADQQAKDMIDALTAARRALPVAEVPGVTDSGKLFITGYSQGGYVAMATQRALQAAGATVTASAPLSGPYALSAFSDAVFQGRVNTNPTLFSVLLSTSYLRSYGTLSNPTDIYEPQFADGIDMLLPTNGSVTDLFTSGRIPQFIFSSTPPDPEFAAQTPATTGPLPSIYARGFGEPHLVTNAFRLSYLRDAQTNPDGGFPTTTDNLPPANPANPLRVAFKTNDLRTWAPTAPTLLCAGNSDPTVFFMNTQLIQGYFSMTSPSAPVTVVDVDSPAGMNDPFAASKQAFAFVKGNIASAAVSGGATDGGAAAVLAQYHGLVAPFCLLAAQTFFADK